MIAILIFLPFVIGSYQIYKKSIEFLPYSTKISLERLMRELNLRPEIIKSLHKIPINYMRGSISQPKLLEINIKYKNLAKLKQSRNNALKKGVLLPEDANYTKAEIKYEGNNYPIRLRLKGDHLDHLQGNKWSYRIKVLEEKTILGMKKFSLQVPEVRNFLGEPIFHKLLEKEGLPNLRYEVVNLKLNGKDLGIYTIEEHFDKYLIENNRMREGIIIALSENSFWNESIRKYKEPIFAIQDSYMNRDMKIFDSNRLISNQNLQYQANDAYFILKKFLDGELSVSKAFDIEKTAKFFAVVDLAGAHHAIVWNNMRFIYNPVNKLLIPIGFDGDGGNTIGNLSIKQHQVELFFRDLEFTEKYIDNLERISKKEYLDEFFEDNKSLLKGYINKYYKSYPWIKSYIKKLIYLKKSRIHKRKIKSNISNYGKFN